MFLETRRVASHELLLSEPKALNHYTLVRVGHRDVWIEAMLVGVTQFLSVHYLISLWVPVVDAM